MFNVTINEVFCLLPFWTAPSETGLNIAMAEKNLEARGKVHLLFSTKKINVFGKYVFLLLNDE